MTEIVKMVPLDSIVVDNASQPRDSVFREDVEALAESIREEGLNTAVWVIEPDADGKRKLIAGAHRIDACILLGWTEIPAKEFPPMTPAKIFNMQVMENSARLDMKPMEKIKAYVRSHNEFGTSVEKMAKVFKTSSKTIHADMPIATLPVGLHQLVDARELSKELARELADLVGKFDDKEIEKAYNHARRAKSVEKQKERLKSWRQMQEQGQTSVEKSKDVDDHATRKRNSREFGKFLTSATKFKTDLDDYAKSFNGTHDEGIEAYLDGVMHFRTKEMKSITDDLETVREIIKAIDMATVRHTAEPDL